MKKIAVAVLACLSGIALSGSAFAANEAPHFSQTGGHQVVWTEIAPTTSSIKTLPCSDFDPQTGGLKGWTPEMGIGPVIPAQMIPKNCPAIIAWQKAHPVQPINPNYNPKTGLKGWKPDMGVGPALTPEGNFYPAHQQGIQTQLPASADHLPPNPVITHTTAIKPYKCSDFNPTTGALKSWNPAWGLGPEIPAQLLPKNCPALEHHMAPVPPAGNTAQAPAHFKYKCSDFNPKTGGLKSWNPAWGLGPAIPASELPDNCPALTHHNAVPQGQFANAQVVLGGVTYQCGDLDLKTGTWKGWNPAMGLGPVVPPQLAKLCKILTA